MKVIKRDGTIQPFDEAKLNRWASYAARDDIEWGIIARETFKRLPNVCTSQQIHETMINVCLAQESLEFSRFAARLLIASIRKNMEKHLGINDKGKFHNIKHHMRKAGIWNFECKHDLDEIYKSLYDYRFEYWQIKQWMDKYALKIDGDVIETPHIGLLAIAAGTFDDKEKIKTYATNLVKGRINLPTPVLNGVRNGDFDSISCCVISGGDSVDSIGVASHIAYKMTAKKAGIGIELTTRSIDAPVKSGRVKHLGKHPLYKELDAAVKMFTQVSRGGSATVTYTCIDPELEKLLLLKTQKIDEKQRIDKIDYSFGYCDAFVEAVVNNKDWFLFDYLLHKDAHEALYDPKTTYADFEALAKRYNIPSKSRIPARTILKSYLTSRQETGRIYCINLSRANSHTPFTDTIRLSNLCQEICLPTVPYEDMADLYAKKKSIGETAFCSLGAINPTDIDTLDEYQEVADILVEAINIYILKAPMMTEAMKNDIMNRKSIGVGITGLAQYLYKQGLDYGDEKAKEATAYLAESHYYCLLRASQKLCGNKGMQNVPEGIDLDWLPIDTMKNTWYKPQLDWEKLRGLPRVNSVLVAHMPTESSAVFSNATNGLYPVRERVINKQSRHGNIQYIAPTGSYKLAWDINNNVLADIYSIVQDFTDQAISADYYVDFTKHPNGKVGLAQLMKEWVYQARKGVKTMYYVNSNDDNGGMFSNDDGCEGGACKL